jgi:hypothetical protein
MRAQPSPRRTDQILGERAREVAGVDACAWTGFDETVIGDEIPGSLVSALRFKCAFLQALAPITSRSRWRGFASCRMINCADVAAPFRQTSQLNCISRLFGAIRMRPSIPRDARE